MLKTEEKKQTTDTEREREKRRKLEFGGEREGRGYETIYRIKYSKFR